MRLAALAAMILRALLPAGLMVEPVQGKLVICTGQGPLTQTPDDHGKAPAPDAPCLFVAHAQTAAPPEPAVLALIDFPLAVATVHGRSETIVPGRGLAAPPPPSHAPPVLI
jgi:hypothetical protein